MKTLIALGSLSLLFPFMPRIHRLTNPATCASVNASAVFVNPDCLMPRAGYQTRVLVDRSGLKAYRTKVTN